MQHRENPDTEMSCPLPGTGHCAQPGTGQCCVTSTLAHDAAAGDMVTWGHDGDMKHRQGTCRTGNSGYPGTKEPTLQIVLSLHDCCMLTALCRPHSGSVRGGGARRTATLALVAVWRPVRGERGAARVAPRVRRTSADVRGAGETTPAQQQQSPTPERSYCYTAVLLWFLMPVEIIET